MPERIKCMPQVNLDIRRGPVVFGEVVYEPGGVHGPRVQKDYQLVVMHSGALELSIDKGKIDVLAGCAILLSPNHAEHFRFSKKSKTHHSWCSIEPKSVPPALRKQWRNLNGPAVISGRVDSLLELSKKPPIGDPRVSQLDQHYYFGLALSLLSEFALEVQNGSAIQSPSERAVAKIDDFIAREMSRPIALSELAKTAAVSKQHLLKLFRSQGMETPMNYLYSKRLAAALPLLSHTGLRIGEIANRCGFANAFHFSRRFKAAYGANPKAWRIKLLSV